MQVGLKKLGNTCFLNAVLQCLKVVDGRNWREVREKVKSTSTRSSTVWEEYLRTIDTMREGHRHLFSPVTLRNAIGNVHPLFDCSVQLDVHELMLLLLESMNGCPLRWGGSGWETACCGQLCSTTKCNQCGYTSHSDEKSAIHSLGIPKSSRGPNTSVIDCLRKFFVE